MSSKLTSIARTIRIAAVLGSVIGCRTSGQDVDKHATATAGDSVADAQEIVRVAATAPTSGNIPTSLTIFPTNPGSNEVLGTYTISLAVFIPSNHIVAPPIHPQSFAGPDRWIEILPRRLVFSGDDRGFDVDSARFRAKQVVTLVPDEASDADGLYDSSKLNIGGQTESFFAKSALADGKLDDHDRLHGHRKGNQVFPFREKVPVDTSGMLIDDPIRLGPKRVSVRLHTARSGGPRDQLLAGAPSIDWDFTIVIDTSGPTPKYELAGSWDGYPAMEIYINRQPIYQYRGEDRSPTLSDLMKLVPGYGDLKVETSGMLTRTTR